MAKPSRQKSSAQEYLEALVVAGLLTLFLRQFVLQAFRIPSESMCDTLLVGDFLFVNKLEYGPRVPFTHLRLPGLRAPRRGDVIVFQFPRDPSQDYIKRCIGTPGHTIEVRHKRVYEDGHALVEPYARHADARELPANVSERDNLLVPTVAPGTLFMMGDNRDNSYDSRFWGPVGMDLVKGRAMFIYFSTRGKHAWDAPFTIRFDRLLRPIR